MTEQLILTPGVNGPTLITALNTPQQVTNNTEQVEAIYDLTAKLMLRGGYRREWGDATVRAGALDQSGPLAFGELKRNVALAGATIRPIQKVSLNFDYESAGTTQDYFRNSLYTYYKVRARGRSISPSRTLLVPANFAFLDNQNPARPRCSRITRSRDDVPWRSSGLPNGSKRRISVMAPVQPGPRSTPRHRLSAAAVFDAGCFGIPRQFEYS